MSKQQLNTWRVYCDACGIQADLTIEGDFSPDNVELAKHGFHTVLVPHDKYEAEEKHLCNHCWADGWKDCI